MSGLFGAVLVGLVVAMFLFLYAFLSLLEGGDE